MSKNAKQYRIERDSARADIKIHERALDEYRKEVDRLTDALKSIGHTVIKGLSKP